MEQQRSKWWPWALSIALAYWALAFVATHLPGSSIANNAPPDKMLHFVAYAGLAFLLTSAEVLRCGSRLAVYLRVLATLAIYGAVDEWSQLLIAQRHADVWDSVVNVCGAATGIMAVSAGCLFRPQAVLRHQ